MKFYRVGWEDEARPLFFEKFENALVYFTEMIGWRGGRSREVIIDDTDPEFRHWYDPKGGKITLGPRSTQD
jgi:hypothetical protein